MPKSPGPHKSPRGLTMRSVEQTSQNVATWHIDKAASNLHSNLSECGHAQPQTTANTDNLKPMKIMNKTASKQPQTPQSASKSSCFKHSARGTKKPRLQPTSQPQPTNQPSSQPIDRPTDGPATANQPNLPTNQARP